MADIIDGSPNNKRGSSNDDGNDDDRSGDGSKRVRVDTCVDREWVCGLPKCELHLHIEGTLEPELMFELAKSNEVALKYKSVEEVRSAYNFDNLQSFLDLYYAGCAVLIKKEDFALLAYTYLKRAHHDGVQYCELFFDPQTHTVRGVTFATVLNGLKSGMKRAQDEFQIQSQLIMCFLRHLSEEDALATLAQAAEFRDDILGVGLDSGEEGNPPLKFRNAYEQAQKQGYRLVAHCAEEGPPQYITDGLSMGIERVDHGVRCLEDDAVVEVLRERQIPLTVCPLSNYKLQVYKRYFEGRCCVRDLITRGLMVTLNSDDPSYFGGYTVDNYMQVIKDCELTKDEVVQLAKNGFIASFLPEDKRVPYVNAITEYAAN